MGVPDIVVAMNGRSPLLVDAKFRTVTTDTRSEETYKMLGYAENFRERIAPGGLQGALIFIGRYDLMTVLDAPDGGRLALVVLDQSRTAPAPTEQLFEAAVGDWLAKAPGTSY
ncbi:MAG: hypothetical protein ACRDI2_22890 [Chloroflexota bacterium]